MKFMILLSVIGLLMGCGSIVGQQASVENTPKTSLQSKEVKEVFDISDIEIEYKRAFVHDVNAITIQLGITNNSGYDVEVDEMVELATTGAEGFQLYHQNSYSMNGEVLKDGETERMTLLYFKNGTDARNTLTVQPSFNIIANDQSYRIDGKVMDIE